MVNKGLRFKLLKTILKCLRAFLLNVCPAHFSGLVFEKFFKLSRRSFLDLRL